MAAIEEQKRLIESRVIPKGTKPITPSNPEEIIIDMICTGKLKIEERDFTCNAVGKLLKFANNQGERDKKIADPRTHPQKRIEGLEVTKTAGKLLRYLGYHHKDDFGSAIHAITPQGISQYRSRR